MGHTKVGGLALAVSLVLVPAHAAGSPVVAGAGPGAVAGPSYEVVARALTARATTSTELRTAARRRVLFGHQSVGWNIMAGIADLYRLRRVAPAVSVRAWAPTTPARGAYLAEVSIGSNGDPASKIRDFAAIVRGGAGRVVQVAVMKLCFVDITSATDVAAVFRTYRATLSSLARAYPAVAFVHTTAPLTSSGTADNLRRERFNALMRAEYAASGRLVDIARVESTRPSGSRVRGTVGGHRYYAMYQGYTTDGGHLNARGSRRVAAAFLRVVAHARP